MKEKKTYIWRLAEFLSNHQMKMSVEELASHLNRNNFLTSYGTEYTGGRGTYKLVRETWKWLQDEMELEEGAAAVASAFVKSDGEYAYE